MKRKEPGPSESGICHERSLEKVRRKNSSKVGSSKNVKQPGEQTEERKRGLGRNADDSTRETRAREKDEAANRGWIKN
ncbi:hypothetical protein TNCT_10571 [Trichonephila clavata]|uniref:Uncharacterized protein n=1 Tax=Trichonephila clavata TaxID=2740835 RepID=A0A8X6J4E3_TRICU|nr:hypothetical protein TNCT_10571 [Trichonephila clavata]